jgi:hypothetical protein
MNSIVIFVVINYKIKNDSIYNITSRQAPQQNITTKHHNKSSQQHNKIAIIQHINIKTQPLSIPTKLYNRTTLQQHKTSHHNNTTP